MRGADSPGATGVAGFHVFQYMLESRLAAKRKPAGKAHPALKLLMRSGWDFELDKMVRSILCFLCFTSISTLDTFSSVQNP